MKSLKHSMPPLVLGYSCNLEHSMRPGRDNQQKPLGLSHFVSVVLVKLGLCIAYA